MKLRAFDIESGPQPTIRETIQARHPFDPDAVKMGNLKDPQKIAEKLAVARAEHESKLIEKAPLRADLGYVVAFSWYDLDNGPQVHIAENYEQEIDCLLHFTAMVRENHDPTLYAGWNSGGIEGQDGFDLIFLIQRCWIRGVPIPPTLFRQYGIKFNARFRDLMRVWTLGKYQEYAKLSNVAELLGCVSPYRNPSDEGKHFHEWVKAGDFVRANNYAIADLFETYGIGRKLLAHELEYGIIPESLTNPSGIGDS